MSNFRDLIARMAIDAEFARHARANPDAVARQYRLNPDESEQLRGLADAAASAGPTALGARLSKMGGLISTGLAEAVHFHAEPISPGVLDPGVIHIDPDTLDPNGDPDHDGIPNILDAHNNDPNTSNEPWGDYDHDGKPNVYDPQIPGQYNAYKFMLALSPDHDHDGIVDQLDSNDNSPDTSHEALGDNDHDGIPNYLDHRFNLPIHDLPTGVLDPVITDPGGGGTGDPTPPPDSGDHTPPPGDGDHHTPPPVDPATPVVVEVPQAEAAPQQPVMLADDALAKPVAPQGDGLSVGEQALIIGGAAIAGGAIVGGVAGVVLNKAKSSDEE
jgi:hypothetical protein